MAYLWLQVTTITKDKLRAEDSLMKTEQELTGAKSKHEAEIYNLQKSACHGECQIKLLQAEMRHQEEVSQLMEDALKSQVQNHEQKLAVETQHKESLKSLLAQEATKNNELREDNNDLDKKVLAPCLRYPLGFGLSFPHTCLGFVCRAVACGYSLEGNAQ
eukprot:5631555-Pleurochrysis_carterae.AAC.2